MDELIKELIIELQDQLNGKISRINILLWTATLIVGSNFILTLIGNIRVINKTHSLDRKMKLFQERIKLCNSFFKDFNSILYSFTSSYITDVLRAKNSKIRREASDNYLLLTRKLKNRIDDLCDYIDIVLSDSQRRDISIEKNLLENLKKEFDKA